MPWYRKEKVRGYYWEGGYVKGYKRKVPIDGPCIIGLIPTLVLFLPFMTIYPNQKALLSIVNFHKKTSSPILNNFNFKCQFTPSCSEYSKLAIKKYGAIKGGFRSIWRIIRCNPFNRNKGIDYP